MRSEASFDIPSSRREFLKLSMPLTEDWISLSVDGNLLVGLQEDLETLEEVVGFV